MKRLALVAAALVLTACAAKEEAPAVDSTAAPAMAPAPAVVDTAAMAAPAMDSGMAHDSTKKM